MRKIDKHPLFYTREMPSIQLKRKLDTQLDTDTCSGLDLFRQSRKRAQLYNEYMKEGISNDERKVFCPDSSEPPIGSIENICAFQRLDYIKELLETNTLFRNCLQKIIKRTVKLHDIQQLEKHPDCTIGASLFKNYCIRCMVSILLSNQSFDEELKEKLLRKVNYHIVVVKEMLKNSVCV